MVIKYLWKARKKEVMRKKRMRSSPSSRDESRLNSSLRERMSGS
jgi:hypothetical protein